jgi:ADP-ribosylglycohydrolase
LEKIKDCFRHSLPEHRVSIAASTQAALSLEKLLRGISVQEALEAALVLIASSVY